MTLGRCSNLNLTNDTYLILIGTKNFTERYYRDKAGWWKVSARGRTFRMTAEQVLNHVLPALAGIKPNLTLKVEHRELAQRPERRSPTRRESTGKVTPQRSTRSTLRATSPTRHKTASGAV